MGRLIGCMACGASVSQAASACPSCGHPIPKPRSSAGWVAVAIFGFVLVSCSVISAVHENERQEEAVAAAARVERQHQGQAASELTACQRGRAERVDKFKALWAQGKYDAAGESLGDCPKILKDQELVQMFDLARVKTLTTQANDAHASPDDRIGAITTLRDAYPASVGKLATLLPGLEAKAAHEKLIAAREADRLDRARRRKEGVSIGMSEDDALKSSWGRPSSVNRTTTARGVHEQWVYPGGYLYFDDGVLTSVQN